MKTDQPLLLYDGKCGFCQATVQFVLRHDRKRLLRFATLEGTHGRAVVGADPGLERVDSVIWVETDDAAVYSRVFARTDAVLQLAGYLGGFWSLLRVLKVVPRPWRDGIYDFVARHRHAITGRVEGCLIPRVEDRDRFLD